MAQQAIGMIECKGLCALLEACDAALKAANVVLVGWENEAFMLTSEIGKDKFEIVAPSVSILAEPPVAMVDKNVDRHKTREVAEAYLKYTYTDEAQEIIAKHFYRPSNESVLKKNAATFPDIRLFSITEIAKSFQDAHKQFIGDGGVFDTIYKPK